MKTIRNKNAFLCYQSNENINKKPQFVQDLSNDSHSSLALYLTRNIRNKVSETYIMGMSTHQQENAILEVIDKTLRIVGFIAIHFRGYIFRIQKEEYSVMMMSCSKFKINYQLHLYGFMTGCPILLVFPISFSAST